MNKLKFKQGFINKALADGFDNKVAEELFDKIAFGENMMTPEDIGNYKNILARRGAPMEYGVDPGQPEARQYNMHMLNHRDSMAKKDPQIASLKAGLGHGLVGAGLGAGVGALMKRFGFNSRWKPGLSALGGAAMGVRGANRAEQEVQLAKKMQDPNNLETFIQQMAKERALANNQF